ncbi:MAG: preprotein translocase subunit SecY [Chloroflexi bacterium]|nr:preprotein translocase subunit SecY [Chloroflexota bacterium]
METIQAVINAFKLPDLRRKILFTLGILVVYRLAAHIPVPGADVAAVRELLRGTPFLGLLNMLSGGGISNFSVMLMGVYPYITASIILQVLTPLVPRLQELAKEGEAGRNRINQYTYLLTVPLAFLQGWGQISALISFSNVPLLTHWGFGGEALLPTIATLFTVTAGTMFALWLAERITEQGIGNGTSIIIFGGIVADIPFNLQSYVVAQNWPGLLAFVAIVAATVVGIVLIYEGQRRVPVQYGKRVRGMKVYGGQSTHIPLRVNSAGMIPLIFAQSLLLLPSFVAQYFMGLGNPFIAGVAQAMFDMVNGQGLGYWLIYFLMVVGFTYFYTDVVFQQQNIPETLQRQGGFIPGIRPGPRTQEYLTRVLHRITLVGALFLGTVALLPFFTQAFTQQQALLIAPTGLLIVVGVVLDTMKQLEAQLLMRHYEGFLK